MKITQLSKYSLIGLFSLLAGCAGARVAQVAWSGVSVEDYEKNLAAAVEKEIAQGARNELAVGEPYCVPQSSDITFAQLQGAAAAVAQRYELPLVEWQRHFNECGDATCNDADKFAAATIEAWRAQPVTNSCLITRAKLQRDGYDWWQRHEKILKLQKELNPEIVFVGDSITHFWAGRTSIGEKGGDTLPRWSEKFGAWRTLNIGYGWDRIQNVLWRLAHGEMDGLNPSRIVLHIGTNNVGGTKEMRAASAAEIAEGTVAVIRRLEEKAPNAKIILMAIFPRGEKADGHWRKVTAASNAMLKEMVKDDKRVIYLDIGAQFLDANGDIPKALMGDFCHPTTAGYDIWANAILPYLKD